MTASHLFLLSKFQSGEKLQALWVGKHLNEQSAGLKIKLYSGKVLKITLSLNAVLVAVTSHEGQQEM